MSLTAYQTAIDRLISMLTLNIITAVAAIMCFAGHVLWYTGYIK